MSCCSSSTFSVGERIRHFGILKAIGLTPKADHLHRRQRPSLPRGRSLLSIPLGVGR